MKYAKNTKVGRNKSKFELEILLDRFGCDDIYPGRSKRLGIAFVMFTYAGKLYRFDFKLPNPDDFKITDTGRTRKDSAARQAWERAERESWRLLVQMVKMTLFWVESKNETFERAFAGRLITGNNEIIADLILRNVDDVCAGVDLPKLLTG